MKKRSNRIYWIDNLRGILMLFVVCFHYKYSPSGFVKSVYPFTLSFFFAVSGYFFRDRNENIFHFFVRKVKCYFPVIIVNAFLACVLNGMTGDAIVEMFKKIVLQLYGCESLWFIACMFVAQLIMYAAVRASAGNAGKVLAGCTALSIAGTCWTCFTGIRLAWSIDIAAMQMAFLGLGYWYRYNEKNVYDLLKKYAFLFLLVYVGLMIFNPTCDIHRRTYDCIWLYHFQAISGIALITVLAREKLDNTIPMVTYLGKNSMYVYAFHGYCLIMYNRIIQSAMQTVLQWQYAFLTVGAVAVTAVMMYVVIYCWQTCKGVIQESRNVTIRPFKERNSQIEGIRALALLMVVGYHFFYRFYEIYGGECVHWMKELGIYGVSAFFIISGCFAVNRAKPQMSRKHIIIDTCTRILKLWVPYAVAITLIFVVTRWVELPGRTVDVKTYVMNVFLLNGFVGGKYVDAAHWYMTEMVALIAVGMVIHLLKIQKAHITYIVWLLLSICCLEMNAFLSGKMVEKLLVLVQLMLGGKYIGAYIAGIMLHFLRNGTTKADKGKSLIGLLAAVTVFTYMNGVLAGIVMILLLVIVWLAINERVPLLSWKPLTYIGMSSYGVYLIHQNLGYMLMLHIGGHAGTVAAIFCAAILGGALTVLKMKTDVFLSRLAVYVRECV